MRTHAIPIGLCILVMLAAPSCKKDAASGTLQAPATDALKAKLNRITADINAHSWIGIEKAEVVQEKKIVSRQQLQALMLAAADQPDGKAVKNLLSKEGLLSTRTVRDSTFHVYHHVFAPDVLQKLSNTVAPGDPLSCYKIRWTVKGETFFSNCLYNMATGKIVFDPFVSGIAFVATWQQVTDGVEEAMQKIIANRETVPPPAGNRLLTGNEWELSSTAPASIPTTVATFAMSRGAEDVPIIGTAVVYHRHSIEVVTIRRWESQANKWHYRLIRYLGSAEYLATSSGRASATGAIVSNPGMLNLSTGDASNGSSTMSYMLVCSTSLVDQFSVSFSIAGLTISATINGASSSQSGTDTRSSAGSIQLDYYL